MKKQMKFGKWIACLLVIAMLVISLASCGSGKANANDASGTHGSLTWSYVKDTKTLTVSGLGEMANFENAEAAVWLAVCTSAEKLVISEGITSIGNYAFYYLPQLTEVTLPSTLSVIGDYGFAFCCSLEEIVIPAGLTAVGKSAFEGCGALKSIYLPAGVNTIGERAFAYCHSMTSALITGEPASIGTETFKNCTALEHLVFRTTVTEDRIAADAFLGAKKGFADAIKTDNATGESRVIVRYMQDGTELVELRKELSYAYGTDYAINTPTREGYTADIQTVNGTANGATHEVTVTYTAIPQEETEAPVEETPSPEEDKKITPTMIVSLVIMAVVLVAIGVGAFLLMRSDKKSAKGGTVRKNDAKNSKNRK